MSWTIGPSQAGLDALAAAGRLAAACALGLALAASPPMRQAGDMLSAIVGPLCSPMAAGGDSGRPIGTVTPVASYPLANVPGKRVTIVRVTYAPGGFTPPHRHEGSVTAYIVSGTVRSQLGGGPVETFVPGQTFFEPPGTLHLVSENASSTEPAELIAVFVADEGATLTTYLE